TRRTRSRRGGCARRVASISAGMGLVVRRAACVLHPVAPRPADSPPGLHVHGPEAEKPAGLAQRRLEILGTVLAEVAERHARRDLYPLAADVRSFVELGDSLPDHLLQRL